MSENYWYFITSLTDIKAFSRAVREHLSIENSLHWCLDMTFREDYSRIRKDHSAENMAVVRHIAMNIIQSFPAKISLARKRRRCSYDDALLPKSCARLMRKPWCLCHGLLQKNAKRGILNFKSLRINKIGGSKYEAWYCGTS